VKSRPIEGQACHRGERGEFLIMYDPLTRHHYAKKSVISLPQRNGDHSFGIKSSQDEDRHVHRQVALRGDEKQTAIPRQELKGDVCRLSNTLKKGN